MGYFLRTLLLAPGEVIVGGQAVLEGVMMKVPEAWAVAVRTPSGEIQVKRGKAPSRFSLFFLNWPFIRGPVILGRTLLLGFRALQFSAEVAMAEEEVPQDSQAGPSRLAMAGTLILSLGLAVGLFFLLPLFLTHLLQGKFPALAGGLAFNLTDGVIRVLFFLIYVIAIGLARDIRRVFAYHGAEHQVVHTWEAEETLLVSNAKTKSPLHPRCGTAFLLFVMVISIFVFALIPQSVPLWAKALGRLIFLPLVAGVAYEAIRLSAKLYRFALARVLLWPGLGLQLLTTRRPNDEMLEVAILALKEALDEAEDGSQAA